MRVLLKFALISLLAIAGRCDDDADVEEKEAFVASKFVKPSISTPTYLLDFFGSKDGIGKNWIKSSAKKDGVDANIAKYNGEWAIDTPTEVSIENDFGLIVKTKARHHAIAAKLTKPYKFEDKPLVVQYEVKYEDGQECGGGYIKLLSEGAEKDLASVQDKTPYTIMFGPDKCGTSGKVHLIFRYKNPKNGSIDEYHAKQPPNVGSSYWDDHKTHLYTLVVKPDGAFVVAVDQKQLFYGNMITDLVPSLTPPKEIADPIDKKPSDWDDRAEIEDETAVKPEDWDENEPKEIVDEAAVKPSDWNEEEPELIPDPESKKPLDWDNDMDGDWEPPSIDNPACKAISGCGPWRKPSIPNPKYKGKWYRPKVANPAYKGVWAPKMIENPHFFEPTAFDGLLPISAIGIELWTMSANIIFDNVLVADSEDVAAEVAKQTFVVRQAEEARLAASKNSKDGFFSAMLEAAEERPWLWAVYVLCVILPLVLLGVFCFGKKSSPEKSRIVDGMVDDEQVPNLVDEEGEEIEEVGEQVNEDVTDKEESKKASTPKNSPSPVKKMPQAMQDIEDDEGSDESSNAEVEGIEEPVVEISQPKSSPSQQVHKRKPRRQD